MNNIDLEKLNRQNFKLIMNALAMPGNIKKINPLYESSLLAVASVFLYSEVSFFYDGNKDISLIETITNPKKQTYKNADYIFCDSINSTLVKDAKRGDHINPDFSAALFFTCKDFNLTKTLLSGPGIDGNKEVNLPCDKNFIDIFIDKNSEYPLGIEVYFINKKDEILALSRTTKVKVL